MKVVINSCYGGFSLSDAAIRRYAEIKGLTLYPEKGKYSSLVGFTYYTVPPERRAPEYTTAEWASWSPEQRIAHNEAAKGQTLYDREIPRDDPALVQVVEEMGEKASGGFAKLSIVEIPDDVNWEIEEYDGLEHVAEAHRVWS